jgi:exonuclease III
VGNPPMGKRIKATVQSSWQTHGQIKKSINMLGLNVNSLPAKLKFGVLEDYVQQFDIISLSETKTDTIDEQNISFVGYTPKFMHREKCKKKSGGICTLFKDEIFAHVTPIMEYNGQGCVQWFLIKEEIIGIAFILGSVYIVPEESSYHTGEEFSNILTDMVNIYGAYGLPFWLTGDFNARTGGLKDYILLDDHIANEMGLSQSGDIFLDRELIDKIGVSLDRKMKDMMVKKAGRELVDLCKCMGILILNGRTGQDQGIGELTCAEASTIDYMIASPSLHAHVEDFLVDEFDPLLSDKHRPIISKLKVLQPTPRNGLQAMMDHKVPQSPVGNSITDKVVRNKWNNNAVKTFQASFNDEMMDALGTSIESLDPNNITKQDMDNLNSRLKNIYQDCGIRSGVTKTYSDRIRPANQKQNIKPNKPFFTEECHNHRKIYLKAKEKNRKQKSNSSKDELLQASRTYRKAIKQAHKQYYKQLHDKLRGLKTNNPKDYWAIINQSNHKAKKGANLSASSLLDHFKELNNMGSCPRVTTSQTSEGNDFFNKPFSFDEIQRQIKKLKNGKAAGADEILNEFLKNSPPKLLSLLTKYFNLILDSGVWPTDWSIGLIVPIYKSKGSTDDPSNYRGITLLSCTSKLFTALLNERLTCYLDNTGLLGEEQAGFRPGYSTTDHIFTLNSILELLLGNKQRLYCAFVDYKKAFDSIDRTSLWAKLIHHGIGGKVLTVLRNLYSDAKSCIRWENKLSEFFSCNVGVRQGENLSPLLFSLYLNDLESHLQKWYKGVKLFKPCTLETYLQLFVLLYADDTIVLGESPEELQQALSGLYDYCQQWHLEVNIDKTKIIVFSRGKIRKKPVFMFGAKEIEIQDSYVYLGTTFTYNGTFNNAIDKQVQQAKRAMYSLLGKARKLNLPLDIVSHLFDSCIIPILLYGCEIWGYCNISKLEAVQRMFYKQLLKLNPSTASCIVLGEVGRTKLETIIHQRMLNYWARLQTGGQSKIAKIIYDLLRQTHYTPNHSSKWIGKVEGLLNTMGFGETWISEEIQYSCSNFSKLVKTRLTDIYNQNWHSETYDSGHCVTYRALKNDCYFESYLITASKKDAITLCRFRAGNSKIPVVTGRFTGTERHKRICQLCQLNEIGDEFHYIMSCPKFNVARKKLIKESVWTRPNMKKLGELFSTSDTRQLHNLAEFIRLVNAAL